MQTESRCGCDARTCDGSFPLLTAHFIDCPHFPGEMRSVVESLVRALEEIMDDADGLPPKGWQAYATAKLMLGEPVKEDSHAD